MIARMTLLRYAISALVQPAASCGGNSTGNGNTAGAGRVKEQRDECSRLLRTVVCVQPLTPGARRPVAPAGRHPGAPGMQGMHHPHMHMQWQQGVAMQQPVYGMVSPSANPVFSSLWLLRQLAFHVL